MKRSKIVIGLLCACLLSACETADTSDTSDTAWKVINFWAVWCAPCREEIPELNKLALDFADQLVVQGVNFDAPDDQAGVEQATSMGIEFDTVSTAEAEKYGLSKPSILPTTFVLNKGQLHAELTGPQTYEALVELMALQANSE